MPQKVLRRPYTANIKLTAGVDIFQRRKITLVLTDNVARLNSRFLSNPWEIVYEKSRYQTIH